MPGATPADLFSSLDPSMMQGLGELFGSMDTGPSQIGTDKFANLFDQVNNMGDDAKQSMMSSLLENMFDHRWI